LFPKFSITDNCNTILPQRQLQNGVVDAYTHVLEQYLTYPHEGHLQDRIAEGILHTLIEVGPKVVEDPTNYELSNMWSYYGLKRFNSKGVPTDWATY
jgi:NADP-dependent alcohol dehydrogenase